MSDSIPEGSGVFFWVSMMLIGTIFAFVVFT